MNCLLSEIKVSLEELKLGMTGALNMSENMENLSTALIFNKVPQVWQAKAYFSNKFLASWFLDLIERNVQLKKWSTELETPLSLYLSYLFNPMSFITAIMQKTAREKSLPLDSVSYFSA